MIKKILKTKKIKKQSNVIKALNSFLKVFMSKAKHDTILSENKINNLLNTVDKAYKIDFETSMMGYTREVKNKYKNAYYNFIKSDDFFKAPTKTIKKKDKQGNIIKKKVIDIKSYNLSDLKPELQKELENRVNISLQYIKTQSDANIEKLKDRLLNWSVINTPNMRGEDFKEMEKKFWNDIVDERGDIKRQKKHINFILRDQQNKMVANFKDITAINNGAIGFIWRNMRDKRVVGNPAGIYPNGNNVHNNHWQREGKLYLIKNNWALKKGYIKKTKDIEYTDEIPDGLPRIAINCRCSAEYVYTLASIPDKYKYIITEKGKEYL